jgi:hypothetical protein
MRFEGGETLLAARHPDLLAVRLTTADGRSLYEHQVDTPSDDPERLLARVFTEGLDPRMGEHFWSGCGSPSAAQTEGEPGPSHPTPDRRQQ